jgi:hypothetical protein
MHVVEIFLPLRDNDGARIPPAQFLNLRRLLIADFGGLTAFARTPADGFWEGKEGTKADEIVVFEVMTDEIDARWWNELRLQLETAFRQKSIVIRAHAIRRL